MKIPTAIIDRGNVTVTLVPVGAALVGKMSGSTSGPPQLSSGSVSAFSRIVTCIFSSKPPPHRDSSRPWNCSLSSAQEISKSMVTVIIGAQCVADKPHSRSVDTLQTVRFAAHSCRLRVDSCAGICPLREDLRQSSTSGTCRSKDQGLLLSSAV